MKTFSFITVLYLAVSEVAAHYRFNSITIAGKKYGEYEGVRENTNMNSPVTDLKSNDLRCNVGGGSGRSTIVLSAKAGDAFSFGLDQAVYHDGPVSLYISRAPGSVQDYDGSAGWKKFYDWGPQFAGGRAQWTMTKSYTNTIPKCLPNGEYLLRIQSLGIHNPYPAGIPQFYISCAQINVTGGPATVNTWAQPVQIPGVFKATDSGYVANIYDPNFKSYEVPGGAVWSC